MPTNTNLDTQRAHGAQAQAHFAPESSWERAGIRSWDELELPETAEFKRGKERLIGINDRVLREGEEVAPGLQLEQITPDGVIMSYKGYRFRRGVR